MDMNVRDICPHAEYDSRINLFKCKQGNSVADNCLSKKLMPADWTYCCTNLEITRRLNDRPADSNSR